MNAQHANWDDLRLFLAVARAGSLSGATRALGTSRPSARPIRASSSRSSPPTPRSA
ncbi:MAG TPA: LysR family transcriptional regulator [Hyphomicrobiaceae bacterium]